MRHLSTALFLILCLFVFSIAYGQAHNAEFVGAPNEKVAAEMQIERLARFYRIQNYELNRTDRAEYDRRGEELRQRIHAWQESDRNAEQARELIDWLNASLGQEGNVPTPRVDLPTEPLPLPRTNQNSAKQSLSPPAPAAVPLSSETSPEVSSELAPELSHESGTTPITDPNLAEDSARSHIDSLPTEEKTSAAEPTAPKLSATENPEAGNTILGGIRSTIDDLVKRVEQVAPISQLPASVPPPVTLPALTDVPDAPPFVSPAFEPKRMPKVDISVPKIGGLAEMRGSALRPEGKTTADSSTEATVNFTEIAALTRSYNVSLEQLETHLSKETTWTADTLEPLVDELEELARRREDLKLYENALSEVERAQLANRDSLDEAIRLTSKRIAEVRKNLTAVPEDSSTDVTRRDLTQLDGFSRRLAKLAEQGEKER